MLRVDRSTKNGESWQWHEFKLTAYHLPGQTLYHAGLMAEGQGLRLLFAGDSFTPAGIDDYCMHNRNWLGQGVGFDYCIGLIEQLQPSYIFNCHVDSAFDFTAEDCRLMRANLAERERLFREITPWDHANYATDPLWLRCDPFEQKVESDRETTVELVITNHSSHPRTASCRPIFPRAWDGKGSDQTWPSEAPSRRVAWSTITVPKKSDARIRLTFHIPKDAMAGRYVIPVDVQYGHWTLPQAAEAIVEF